MNDIPNILQRYFLEMGRFSVLSPAEEAQCAQEISDRFDDLVDEMLHIPFVWNHIFDKWKKLKTSGRASNKLAEEYGNPNYSAEALTLQVDANIEAAISQCQEGDVDKIVYHLKSAGLSKHIFMDLVDEALAQPTTTELSKLRISKLKKAVLDERHRLINANLRLVITFAKKFNGYGISLPDLIQEGNMGLMRAAEKFDPSRNLKFSTYAAWWIRQSFIKALKNQGKTIRLPAHIHDTMAKIKKAHEELYEQLKREPSLEEISSRVGVDPELVDRLINLRTEPLSLETPVSGRSYSGEGRPKQIKDYIEDEFSDPSTEIDMSRRDSAILNEIKTRLTKSEQKVILLRFGLGGYDPHTLEQIAENIGKSRERIRQVESSALEKLKELAPHLEDYQ